MIIYWGGALLLSVLVVLYLRAEHTNRKPLAYICKPAATLTIIAVLWMLSGVESVFLQWVLVALTFSLLGDIFLMLPHDRFLPGLLSFFVAHVAYIVAFLNGVESLTPDWRWGLPVIFGVVLLGVLWSHLHQMKWPVVSYAIVIMGMLISTLERFEYQPGTASGLLVLGAVFFVLSDSLIALDRFKGNVRWPLPGIIVTYFVAQWLFLTAAIWP